MAYGLKYYKDLAHPDGKVVRLEILEKDYSGASKSIGPVCQSLRLDIQGDTEIDAPIVKTSLSMTFVDAPDHEEAATKKCGNWDEFYTSDATLWRVVVKVKKAQGTAFTTIWTGYITPDSYTEVLTYRGSVTIVARDNIGHMNDFPFDAEGDENGMISLRELVEDAWAKIENPMEVIFFGQDWLLSEGVPAFNTRMNVSAFEGKTWFEALESALYGYGATLRWIGGNEVIVRPLRYLPYMGRLPQQDIITAEPVFIAGAERELSPAAKIIEEVAEYDIDNVFVKPPKTTDFSGQTIEVGYYQRELWPLANTEQGKGWANANKNATLFVNPKAYGFLEGFMIDEDKENIYNEIYINGGLTGDVEYSRIINSRNFSLELNLGRILLFEKDFSDPSANWQIASATNSRINSIVYSISISKNGITKWLHEDGSWAAGEVSLTYNKGENETISSMKVALNLEEFIGDVLFSFHIKSIQIDQNDTQKCVSLTGLNLICDDILCEKNNVNTIYNDTNNVILSRDVKIAPSLNTPFLPQVIRNGIFVKEGNIYKPAKLWAWEGETPQQMAVYNHLQLLCYHAKPNNILRGTIVNADNTDMQPVWMWGGAEHMLVSGSLNFLNGHIENAVLREFARYEDMWGMLAPADFPEVEGKSRTTAENGTTTAGEGARTTNTTTVNIGGGGGTITLDTFMSDTSTNGVQNRIIKAYVDGEITDLDSELRAWVNASIPTMTVQAANKLTLTGIGAYADVVTSASQVVFGAQTGIGYSTLIRGNEFHIARDWGYNPWFSITGNGLVSINGDPAGLSKFTVRGASFFAGDATWGTSANGASVPTAYIKQNGYAKFSQLTASKGIFSSTIQASDSITGLTFYNSNGEEVTYVGHEHDYLPLSGGVMEGNLDLGDYSLAANGDTIIASSVDNTIIMWNNSAIIRQRATSIQTLISNNVVAYSKDGVHDIYSPVLISPNSNYTYGAHIIDDSSLALQVDGHLLVSNIANSSIKLYPRSSGKIWDIATTGGILGISITDVSTNEAGTPLSMMKDYVTINGRFKILNDNNTYRNQVLSLAFTKGEDSYNIFLGYDDYMSLTFTDISGKTHELLHSGNIGKYVYGGDGDEFIINGGMSAALSLYPQGAGYKWKINADARFIVTQFDTEGNELYTPFAAFNKHIFLNECVHIDTSEELRESCIQITNIDNEDSETLTLGINKKGTGLLINGQSILTSDIVPDMFAEFVPRFPLINTDIYKLGEGAVNGDVVIITVNNYAIDFANIYPRDIYAYGSESVVCVFRIVLFALTKFSIPSASNIRVVSRMTGAATSSYAFSKTTASYAVLECVWSNGMWIILV